MEVERRGRHLFLGERPQEYVVLISCAFLKSAFDFPLKVIELFFYLRIDIVRDAMGVGGVGQGIFVTVA